MENRPITAIELAAIIADVRPQLLAQAPSMPPARPATRYVQRGADLVCVECGYAVPYCKGHSTVEAMNQAHAAYADRNLAERVAEAARIADERARQGGR